MKSAKILYDNLLRELPDNAEILSNLGTLEIMLGNLTHGIDLLKKSIKINSLQPNMLCNLANALLEINNFQESLRYYAEAIKLVRTSPDLFYNQARAFNRVNKKDLAIKSYDKAILLKPDFVDALNNRGLILHEIKKYNEALKDFNLAIQLNNNNHEFYFNRASLYRDTNKINLAIQDYSKAISLKPNYSDALNNRGVMHYKLHMYELALSDLNNAMRLEVKADFINNKGTVLKDIGNIQDAILCFEEAIQINPNHFIANNNLGICYLLTKQFNKAWDYYEKRLMIYEHNYKNLNLNLNLNFDITNIAGKKILIFSEQGIGDQILFFRLIKFLEKKSTEIYILIDPRLIKLFSKSFLNLKYITDKNSIKNEVFDLKIPLGSLPNLLSLTEKYILESNSKYIVTDKEKVNFFRKTIIQESVQLVCGIAWKSKNEDFGQEKSISLESLLPILKLPHMIFVNLQYGDTKEEIEALNRAYGIQIKTIDEIDNFNDIDELASLIDACDFVVTTSNVTVHLAGGLGKETYLMVPYAHGRVWYWHEGDTQSIWYPSVNIHRQPNFDNWSKPIDEIAHILENKKN